MISKYNRRLNQIRTIEFCGKITRITGLVIEAAGINAPIGEICNVFYNDGFRVLPTEVVGFRGSRTLLMPLGSMEGLGPGSMVITTGTPLVVKVGEDLLGKIIDGLGRPLDGQPPIIPDDEYAISQEPPHPLYRPRITEQIITGIRSIDTFTSIGKGQKIGIFGGSGVGKSVLLGMVARNTEADVNVIALIGERGREVREFIENDLGEEGLKRSIVVVATSDQPALIRIRGAFLAMSVAEYFRDKGADVMLMMDSITRFAMAQREVGLAIDEPPTTRGYPPSVYALLPKLLERCGTGEHGGSITGLINVLVEGDDMNEPISDATRAILDGHIVLSRELATRNHYPAIDVLNSLSRLMMSVAEENHIELAGRVRRTLAIYKQNEDLISIGAYTAGGDRNIDYAIEHIEAINNYLCQEISDRVDFSESLEALRSIMNSGSPDEEVQL